jgi:hypothetical protein
MCWLVNGSAFSQEKAFVGRCGEIADELGSAVVAARLIRDLMRLCLLIGRHYPLQQVDRQRLRRTA